MKSESYNLKEAVILGIMLTGVTYKNAYGITPSYPPLPPYGAVFFSTPSCAMKSSLSAGLNTVSFSVNPEGTGYPAQQYVCTGSFNIIEQTGITPGKSCAGNFSSITPPPPIMFTDAVGNINPSNVAGLIIGVSGTPFPVMPSCITAFAGGFGSTFVGATVSTTTVGVTVYSTTFGGTVGVSITAAGITTGNSVSMQAFISCSLAIGGGVLDLPVFGTSENCLVQ